MERIELDLNRISLRCSSLTHLINGSPVKPNSQLQIGLWFTTWHLALSPQTLSHGFLHFWLMQDLSSGHSELTKHSGWQFGGEPIISGKQLHTAWLSSSRHWLFRPQGDGVHGVSGGTSWTVFWCWQKEINTTSNIEVGRVRKPSKWHKTDNWFLWSG